MFLGPDPASVVAQYQEVVGQCGGGVFLGGGVCVGVCSDAFAWVPRLPGDAHLLGFGLPPVPLGLRGRQFYLGDCQTLKELWDTAGRGFVCSCQLGPVGCVKLRKGAGLLAGRPVERHRVHGSLPGFHLGHQVLRPA